MCRELCLTQHIACIRVQFSEHLTDLTLNLTHLYLGFIVSQTSCNETGALLLCFQMFSLFNLIDCYGTCLASLVESVMLVLPTAIFPCSPPSPLPIKQHYRTVLLWFSSREAHGVGSHLARPTAGPVLHLAVGLPGVSLQQQVLGLIYDSPFSHKVLATSCSLVD